MIATTLYPVGEMLILPLFLLVTMYGYRFAHDVSERLRQRSMHGLAIVGGAMLSLTAACALKMGLALPNAVDGPAIVLVILLALCILYFVESVVFGAIRIARYRQHWADALGWGAWEAVGTVFGGVTAVAFFQMLLFRVTTLLLSLPHG